MVVRACRLLVTDDGPVQQSYLIVYQVDRVLSRELLTQMANRSPLTG